MIPLRFTELSGSDRLLFTTDAGKAFVASHGFLDRYVRTNLHDGDRAAFARHGLDMAAENGLAYTNYLFNLAARASPRRTADYFILVPTLRCNLACGYCQVSRADFDATGYDWTDEICDRATRFIVENSPERVKIEFQGGEPTLRLDIVKRVIEDLETAGKSVEAVICTNLAELSPALTPLLDRKNVFISTSIDGSVLRQARQRMGSEDSASSFFRNVDGVIATYGKGKISALPTIDPGDPPTYDELYQIYALRGLTSIFLRPVNYQGFARKRYAGSHERQKQWRDYYRGFIHYLIEVGEADGYAVSEFYFTQCLARIFRSGENGHVDLRNPSILGVDYFVIDYDGRLFPTDEARMLDRIGEIDLSIGDVRRGVDEEKRDTLNQAAFNDEDPDCIHCAFQPYCGSDIVDAISRYGRVDLPRHDTVFCQNQLDIFDFIFSILAAPTKKQRAALSAWLGLAEPPERFLSVFDD